MNAIRYPVSAAAIALMAAFAPSVASTAAIPVLDSTSSANTFGSPVRSPADGRNYYEVFEPNGVISRRPEGWLEPPSPVRPRAVPERTPVSVIASTGPAANRYGLVFLSDGYTNDEMGDYGAAVKAQWAEVQQVEPFATYRPFFTVYQIGVPSPHPGINERPTGDVDHAHVVTPLSAHLWCHGIERLLCVDDAATRSAASRAPHIDGIFVIANTAVYAGAAEMGQPGPAIAAVAGENPEAVRIIPHELGHTIGGLADEYDTPLDSTAGVHGAPPQTVAAEASFPNMATKSWSDMALDRDKWWRWVGATSPDGGLVGTYRGEMFGSEVNRPSENSLMRTLGRPFSAPDREAVLEGLYRHVHPIDAETPDPNTPVSRSAVLTVSPVPLRGRALDVLWSQDGSTIAGSEGKTTLDLSTLNLEAGAHTVTATVQDTTDWVRDEDFRQKWMTQVVTWNVWQSPCAIGSTTPETKCS